MIATQLGDDRFDDRSGDYSKEALELQEREIKEALKDFEGFDTAAFGLDARVDHRLMVQLGKAILREFEGYQRNPETYSNKCLSGVFLLLIRGFAPLE